MVANQQKPIIPGTATGNNPLASTTTTTRATNSTITPAPAGVWDTFRTFTNTAYSTLQAKAPSFATLSSFGTHYGPSLIGVAGVYSILTFQHSTLRGSYNSTVRVKLLGQSALLSGGFQLASRIGAEAIKFGTLAKSHFSTKTTAGTATSTVAGKTAANGTTAVTVTAGRPPFTPCTPIIKIMSTGRKLAGGRGLVSDVWNSSSKGGSAS